MSVPLKFIGLTLMPSPFKISGLKLSSPLKFNGLTLCLAQFQWVNILSSLVKFNEFTFCLVL